MWYLLIISLLRRFCLGGFGDDLVVVHVVDECNEWGHALVVVQGVQLDLDLAANLTPYPETGAFCSTSRVTCKLSRKLEIRCVSMCQIIEGFFHDRSTGAGTF